MESNNLKKEYSLVDYIKILLNRKKLIIISCLTVGLLTAFLVYFVMDPIFYSTATVKSSVSLSGIGSLLSASGIPDLGGLEELSGGGGSKELAIYQEILQSRNCIEEAILKFNLLEEYKLRYMQDAVKAFREEIMVISSNKKAGTLEIGVFDKSPKRAVEIIEYLIYKLNKIYTELSVQNAKNNRIFIEERYELVKNDLKVSEDSLRIYQDKYGVAPDIQLQFSAQAELELETTIKSEEVKLELLKKILSSNQPEVNEQEEKINILKKQLTDLRNSNDRSSKLQLSGLPKVVLDYLRLKRNVEIQNKILATLIPLYEQAKIEENKDTPTVLVLDKPYLPEYKKKPKRIFTIGLNIFVTFTILSIIVILYDTFIKNIISKLSDDRK